MHDDTISGHARGNCTIYPIVYARFALLIASGKARAGPDRARAHLGRRDGGKSVGHADCGSARNYIIVRACRVDASGTDGRGNCSNRTRRSRAIIFSTTSFLRLLLLLLSAYFFFLRGMRSTIESRVLHPRSRASETGEIRERIICGAR